MSEHVPVNVSEPGGFSRADQRRAAYAKHSDPIFFKWQRGEATKQDWLDAIEKVRQEVG